MMKKILMFFVACMLISTALSSQVQIQKVEASFIANFMRYMKWPNQESFKTFTIGVYGKNQAIFNELTKTVQGKNVGLAKISVVEVETSEDIKKCQMVFVPTGRANKAKKLINGLGNSSIMTITEEQNFVPDFAIVNFKIKDSKLTFQLNSEVAKQKKISVSSRLAQMATN